MKQYFAVGLLLLLAGCQSQNRFSTYGSEIVVYEGDREVLANCCRAAMGHLGDDLRKEKGMDLCPPMNEVVRGWARDGKTTARRMILSCEVDERYYRIDISQIENKSIMVTIDSPSEDSRLVNHLMKKFSNFDVKPVNSI